MYTCALHHVGPREYGSFLAIEHGQLFTQPPSTTSLTTGDLAEKALVERFPEGKSQYLGPILSLFDPNSRNIGRNSLLI